MKGESSGEYYTSSDSDEEESQQSQSFIHPQMDIMHSQPDLLDPTYQIPVLQAKRSLQMQRAASMERSSLDHQVLTKEPSPSTMVQARKYGWVGEEKVDTKQGSQEQQLEKGKKKKKKQKDTIGTLRYLKNVIVQTKETSTTENGQQIGYPAQAVVDGWTGEEICRPLVAHSTQTNSGFGGIDAGLQTVYEDTEEKYVQTWPEEMYGIECQTEAVTSEHAGVQTSGYESREESHDTFETANEEEFWQMKVTQTDVRAVANRLVQTLLTSTFKHEGQKEKKKKGAPKADVSQSLEESQKEQLSKRKTSAEIRARELEIAKRAELKHVFHLKDDEIDHLRTKIKDWRKGKMAELLQKRSTSVVGSETEGAALTQQQVSIELESEEFLQQEKELLLHELKALRAQKQAKKVEQKAKARERLQKKPVPVEEKEYESSSEEEEEDIYKEIQSSDGQQIAKDSATSPSQPPTATKRKKKKTAKPKEQQYQMRVVQSEGGLIVRENFQQAILDVELSRSPNSQARFMPVEEELLISASISANIKLERVLGEETEEETIEEEDIDLEELLKKLSIEGVEDTFNKHDQDDAEESVEDFTANVNTQTEWLDAHILEQLNQVPPQRLHEILPHLLSIKQIRHEFTQTDWLQQEQKEQQVLEDLVKMSTSLESVSPKAILPKAISFSSQFKQTIPSVPDVGPTKIRRQPSTIRKQTSIEAEEGHKRKSTGKFKGSKIERLVSKFEHSPDAARTVAEYEPTHLTAESAQIYSPNLPRQTSFRRGEMSMFTQRDESAPTSQPLLQPTPPMFLKGREASTPSEYTQKLRLPSEKARPPIKSMPDTTPLIRISDTQQSHDHPYPSKIQLSQPAPIAKSSALQTHLLHSGIVSQDMLPTSITRRASVPPPMSTLSHLQPSQPSYRMVEVDQSQLPPQIQAQLEQPSTSSHAASQVLQLAYLPQLDLYIHPSNPSIQLKRSSSGTFVPVCNPLEDILPYMQIEHLAEETVRQSVGGHIVELASGEIQFFPIDSSLPIPEGAQLRGQVIYTSTAIQFLPNPELEEPAGEMANKILREINQLLASGVLPTPMRRRRSRVPELLQARIHFLEELSRREVAFGDVSLKETSHVDRRPSFGGWEKREVQDRNEQLIGWRRNRESRRERMLEVGIQTGVQARVQHLLGWDWQEEVVVLSPTQPTRKVPLRGTDQCESKNTDGKPSSSTMRDDKKEKRE